MPCSGVDPLHGFFVSRTSFDFYVSMLIYLDFESVTLKADLFDTPVARAVKERLPLSIPLTQWGYECYGPIHEDLGEDTPVPGIPPGGLAYSRNGGYLCVFFGQTPAWPVDHIGQIRGGDWKILKNIKNLYLLTIHL